MCLFLKLKLTNNAHIDGRKWHIQACSAITGDGLYEGLDWLGREFKKDQHSNWNILNRLNPFYRKTANTFATNNNTKETTENNNEQVKLPTDEDLKDDVVFLKAFEDTLLVSEVRAAAHYNLYCYDSLFLNGHTRITCELRGSI